VASLPKVTDDSVGQLLIWIDTKGEFHTEQIVGAVPAEARDVVAVRPLESAQEVAGYIFLANLRERGPDGAYRVRLAPRAEFEGVAAARRAGRGMGVLEARPAQPSQSSQTPGEANRAESNTGADPSGTQRPAVIIYGASWCGPCQQTKAFLKAKHVSFIEHDIDEDSSAAREMDQKLARAGMRRGSIPVLDVRGRILVGFEPGSLERALQATANP